MSTTLLEVVTPERVVLTREVNMVSLRTGGGELGILPRHAPLAATVKPGVVWVKTSEGDEFIAVSGGFLEVTPTRVTILATTAELGEQVNIDRALRARERAEGRLNQRSADIDLERAQRALQRALARLEAAERAGRTVTSKSAV